MDVHVTNSGGLSTVNQGNAGVEAWLVDGSAHTQPVSGTFWQATQPVSGTLTCNAGSGTLAVSGPLTDTQLRATPVPVSGSFYQATQPVSGTFWQATQPVSGTLTCNAGTGTQAVSLASLPALATGSNTIGAVNINGTVPISGTITATNSANGDTGSVVPDQATQVAGVDGSGDLRALKVSSTGVLSVDGSAVTQPVSGTFWQATQPVSGTFWQATQPVSGPLTDTQLRATAVPISGTVTANLGTIGSAATAANQTTGNSTLSAIDTKLGGTLTVGGTVTANAGTGTFTVDASGFTVPVSGTFWQATQPVSGTVTANLGTLNGAATAAKQPALGTAGTASADVITVQGIASMTALKTDGSGVTQPVSGTFWQATQPVSGTFWQATQPVSGPLTDTQLRATAVPVSGTFWQATQPVSIATAPVLVAGSAIIGKVGIDQTTPGTTNGVQVNAALPAGSNVIGHVIVDTAPTTTVTGTVAATQSGTWNTNDTPVTPTARSITQAAITVGTSAVRLTVSGSAPSSGRVLLIAQLLSSSTANCYLGSSSVTSSSTNRGVQMFAGQIFTFNNDAGDYYVICDTTSQTFFVTEQ